MKNVTEKNEIYEQNVEHLKNHSEPIDIAQNQFREKGFGL